MRTLVEKADLELAPVTVSVDVSGFPIASPLPCSFIHIEIHMLTSFYFFKVR